VRALTLGNEKWLIKMGKNGGASAPLPTPVVAAASGLVGLVVGMVIGSKRGGGKEVGGGMGGSTRCVPEASVVVPQPRQAFVFPLFNFLEKRTSCASTPFLLLSTTICLSHTHTAVCYTPSFVPTALAPVAILPPSTHRPFAVCLQIRRPTRRAPRRPIGRDPSQSHVLHVRFEKECDEKKFKRIRRRRRYIQHVVRLSVTS
jgi:hypothetical protein